MAVAAANATMEGVQCVDARQLGRQQQQATGLLGALNSGQEAG